LLDRPKRGLYVITENGRKVAEQNPKIIDRDFLMQFPQFVEFAQATGTRKTAKNEGKTPTGESDPTPTNETPEELIGTA
jgi:restriction system protein